jgi:hypothetical protein
VIPETVQSQAFPTVGFWVTAEDGRSPAVQVVDSSLALQKPVGKPVCHLGLALPSERGLLYQLQLATPPSFHFASLQKHECHLLSELEGTLTDLRLEFKSLPHDRHGWNRQRATVPLPEVGFLKASPYAMGRRVHFRSY